MVDPLGHTYTYTDNGADHTIGCANCDYSAIEAHTYVDGTCICGAVEVVEPEYIPNNALSMIMAISVGAEIKVNYTILNANVSSFESFYVEVTKEVAGGESKTTLFSLAEGNIEPLVYNGIVAGYNVIYTGIKASEMGDNFSATLYAVDANGNINYGPTYTSSIKSYLLGKATDAASPAELKTLAIDMLNYGSAAQIFFGYNTENLVNSDLSEELLALGTQNMAEAVDSTAITGTGSNIMTSVSLQNKVYLYLTCMYAPKADSNIKFVIKDKDGKILEELEPTAVYAAACQLSYANVGAAQMRKILNIEVYDNDVLVSQTLTWSVESYVASARANSASSEAMVNVLDAMLVYGDSAAAYMKASGQ